MAKRQSSTSASSASASSKPGRVRVLGLLGGGALATLMAASAARAADMYVPPAAYVLPPYS
jgi:hypothetical protein